jgi:hypothetical protein
MRRTTTQEFLRHASPSVALDIYRRRPRLSISVAFDWPRLKMIELKWPPLAEEAMECNFS